MYLFLADDQDIEARVMNLGLLVGRGKATAMTPAHLGLLHVSQHINTCGICF